MQRDKPTLRQKIYKNRWSYLFIAPKMILFLALTVYPIVMSWVISFYNWSGMEPLTDFVRWKNFIEVAQDPTFWQAFKNSFIYTLGVVPIQLFLSLLAAIALNRPNFRGSTIYRTVLFIPVITTTAIVGIVMVFIFGTYNGVVNEVLAKLHLIRAPIDWLSDGILAMGVIIVVGIWKTFGYNMVYWLAGLQSIPKELYEAAKVDGANFWQRFSQITMPLLRPIGVIILLLAIVGSLNVFDLVKVMTDGGPGHATEVVATYIYRYAFSAEDGVPRLGFASAAGVFYGVTVMIIGIVQWLIVQKMNKTRDEHTL